MERLIGGMLGGDGGGAGFPPTSGGGGDEPASPDEFFAFLQQYTAMGGSLDPDEAPPELGPVLKALAEGSGGVGALREMLAMQPPASAAAAGGRPTVPGAARAPAPQPVGADREEILPEPGFVVKTIDDAGRKIFINVCGHAKIQAPGTEWAGGKVPEHVEHALANLEDPDAVQQLRFPLSVSEGRGELDKAGQPCTAYDAVFNDDVVKQAMAHRKLKVFLVELCLQWVGQKYSLVLDPKYKLPHRRYVGDRPAPQMIRVDRKSMIEEIDEPDEEPTFPLRPRPVEPKKKEAEAGGAGKSTAKKTTTKTSEANSVAGKKIEELSSSMASSSLSSKASSGDASASTSGFAFGQLPEVEHEVSYAGRPATGVEVRVSLPAGVGPDRVRVCAVTEGATVDIPGRRPLRVTFPFAVDAEAAKATFDEETRTVTFRAPYVPYDEVVRRHREAGAHAVGEVKLSSGFLDV